jgi:hypothetical protein
MIRLLNFYELLICNSQRINYDKFYKCFINLDFILSLEIILLAFWK